MVGRVVNLDLKDLSSKLCAHHDRRREPEVGVNLEDRVRVGGVVQAEQIRPEVLAHRILKK